MKEISEGDLLIRVHDLMWANLWLLVSMSFPKPTEKERSMKWRIIVEGGRMFFVKAEDVESAEMVAKTCLREGESIQGIEEVKEVEKDEEEGIREKKDEPKESEGGPEGDREGGEKAGRAGSES